MQIECSFNAHSVPSADTALYTHIHTGMGLMCTIVLVLYMYVSVYTLH